MPAKHGAPRRQQMLKIAETTSAGEQVEVLDQLSRAGTLTRPSLLRRTLRQVVNAGVVLAMAAASGLGGGTFGWPLGDMPGSAIGTPWLEAEEESLDARDVAVPANAAVQAAVSVDPDVRFGFAEKLARHLASDAALLSDVPPAPSKERTLVHTAAETAAAEIASAFAAPDRFEAPVPAQHKVPLNAGHQPLTALPAAIEISAAAPREALAPAPATEALAAKTVESVAKAVVQKRSTQVAAASEEEPVMPKRHAKRRQKMVADEEEDETPAVRKKQVARAQIRVEAAARDEAGDGANNSGQEIARELMRGASYLGTAPKITGKPQRPKARPPEPEDDSGDKASEKKAEAGLNEQMFELRALGLVPRQ